MDQLFKKTSGLLRKIFSKSKFRWSLLALLIIILGGVLFAKDAHAQSLVSQGLDVLGNSIIWAITQFLLLVARVSMSIGIFFLRFFISLAGYNNYIDADIVKLGWVMIRDVANMFFVVVLLAIAIGTILGLEQFEWKKTLVKFILAAVFVNFSDLICGIFIDIAHVFTITFLNAIVAVAGGNFVQMFKLDAITKITGDTSWTDGLNLGLLAGAIMACIMSILAMLTIGAYALIMAIRVIVLWVLIVMSPLAYIFSALPQTENYAKEWWKQFNNQVIAAPIMVFFLWLAFATMGLGNVITEINTDNPNKIENSVGVEAGKLMETGKAGTEITNQISLSDATTWENFGSFLLAMIFLWVGIQKVQETGAIGAGIAKSAGEFGKKVATIASGYAVGRWLVGGAASGMATAGKKAGINTLMNMPLGGRTWVRAAKILDNFRKDNRILKHIPLIGGAREEHHDKLDHRLDKRLKLRQESREARLSIPEEQTMMDDLGGRLSKFTGGRVGFGLQHSSHQKNAAERAYNEDMRQKKEKAQRRSADDEMRGAQGAAKHIKIAVEEDKPALQEAYAKWQETHPGGSMEEYMASGGDREMDDRIMKNYVSKMRDDKDLTDENGKKLTREQRTILAQAVRTQLFGAAADKNKALAEEAKAGARKAVGETDFGRSYLQTIEGAKIGKKMAEDFMKDVGNLKIKANFDDARIKLDALNAALKANPEDPAAKKALNDFLSSNKYGAAIQAEAKVKASEAEVKEARSLAAKSFGETEEGEKFLTRVAAAKIGEKTGTDFEKRIQSPFLVTQYQKARGVLDGLKGKSHEEVREAIAGDKFAEALYNEEMGHLGELQVKEMKSHAEVALDQAEGSDEWARYYKVQDLKRREKAGEELTGDDKTFFDQNKDMVKPHGPGTIRMQMAAAEVATQANESYFKTVKRNADRFSEAANELDLLDQEEAVVAPSAVEARRTRENADNKRRNFQYWELMSGEGGQIQLRQSQRALDILAIELAEAKKSAGENPADPEKRKKADDLQKSFDNQLQSHNELSSKISQAPQEVVKARTELTEAERVANEKQREADANRPVEEAVVRGIRARKENLLISNSYAASIFQEQRAKLTDARVKEQQARILEQFGKMDIGRQIITAIADADVGATIGEDLVKVVKNQHWEDKFLQAKERISVALKAGDKGEIEQLGISDKYVKVMKRSQVSKLREMMAKTSRADAEAMADQVYSEMNVLGFGTPSTALDSTADQFGKPMNKLDEAGRGRVGAINIGHLARAVKTGRVSFDMTIGTYGVLKNLVEQANLDDAGGAMAIDAMRLERGDVSDSEQREEIEAMVKLFGPEGELPVLSRVFNKSKKGTVLDKNGVDTGKKEEVLSRLERIMFGNIDYEGSDDTVNILQNWMLSGGNIKLFRTHRKIDEFMTRNRISDYSVGARRWFQEEYSQMSDDEKGKHYSSPEEMKTEFDRMDTKLQEGAEGFKKDGLDTKHTENVGHQTTDQEWGGLRFSRVSESRDIVDGNNRKRSGNQQTNYHSLGVVGYHSGLLRRINIARYASQHASVARKQDMTGRLDRTRKGCLAQGPSERAVFSTKKGSEGIAVYGGGRDSLTEKFGSTINVLADNLLPQIIGGLPTLVLDMQGEYGDASATWQEAEKGKLRVIFETDDGNEIRAEHAQDLITGIIKKYGDSLGVIVERMRHLGLEDYMRKSGKILSRNTEEAARQLRNLLEERRGQAALMKKGKPVTSEDEP